MCIYLQSSFRRSFNPYIFFVRSHFSTRTIRILEKGELQEVSYEKIAQRINSFQNVHFDLGTGDGKFVYKQAKAHPDTFVVGVDTNPSAMGFISAKVAKKPSKGGGVTNTAFICSSVETLPDCFSTLADRITINFPWAGLLNGLIEPDERLLNRIVQLAKDQASIEIQLNFATLNSNLVQISNKLVPIYRRQGIHLVNLSLRESTLHKSTWGQRLTLGSQRPVLTLIGKINSRTSR